jgi:hypothetical protein
MFLRLRITEFLPKVEFFPPYGGKTFEFSRIKFYRILFDKKLFASTKVTPHLCLSYFCFHVNIAAYCVGCNQCLIFIVSCAQY